MLTSTTLLRTDRWALHKMDRQGLVLAYDPAGWYWLADLNMTPRSWKYPVTAASAWRLIDSGAVSLLGDRVIGRRTVATWQITDVGRREVAS